MHCGHTFCRLCLEAHLTYLLNAFIANNPGFDQVLANLRLYHAALSDPGVDLGTRYRIRQELGLIAANTPLPTYACPACRGTISMKPTRELALRAIIDHAVECLGEQNPEYADRAGTVEQWHLFLLS